jgi:hypothetical protein
MFAICSGWPHVFKLERHYAGISCRYRSRRLFVFKRKEGLDPECNSFRLSCETEIFDRSCAGKTRPNQR